MSLADVNGDGQVNYEEFKGLARSRHVPRDRDGLHVRMKRLVRVERPSIVENPKTPPSRPKGNVLHQHFPRARLFGSCRTGPLSEKLVPDRSRRRP